jgi:hypothetical protein
MKNIAISLSQGIYPTCFKNAVVTPLIKNVLLTRITISDLEEGPENTNNVGY